MILPSRNLSQQLKIAMPVIRGVLERISNDDGYTTEPNYEEGSLPFISPVADHEIILSITNIATIGQGERRPIYNIDGYGRSIPTDSVSNLKEITITVRVNFDELTDDINAWSVMNNIRDRLRWDSIMNELEEVNVGIMRWSDARNISFNFRGSRINAFEMDIIFSTSTNDPENETGTWIESVQLNSDVISNETETSYDINEELP